MRLEAAERALDALIERSGVAPEGVLAAFRSGPSDAEELERAVAGTVAAAGALAGRAPERRLRWAMGRVMPRFLGRLDPEVVRARLAEALEGTPLETGR